MLRIGPVAAAGDLPDVPEGARTRDAVQLAAGAGLVIAGLTASDEPGLVPILVAVGALAGVPALLRLVPAGTLRARAGVPATVLARGVQTFAFFGTDAFVPLAIQEVRHESVTYTGIVLTVSTLSWTATSWVMQHYVHRWGPRVFVRLGFACILAGIIGVAAALSPSVPVWTVAVSWSIGAAGMGFSYSALSVVVLNAAEPGREGAASASIQLSDQLGFALGTGVAGAAVALGEALGWVEADSLLVGAAITATVATGGLLLAGRVPRALAEPSASPASDRREA
jgi:MFS family permease